MMEEENVRSLPDYFLWDFCVFFLMLICICMVLLEFVRRICWVTQIELELESWGEESDKVGKG